MPSSTRAARNCVAVIIDHQDASPPAIGPRTVTGRCRNWSDLAFLTFDGRRNALELNDERRAAVTAATFGANSPVVRLHHCFGNREAEAEASKSAGDCCLSLLKRVENSLELLRLDAEAGIGDADLYSVGRGICRLNDYSPARRRELHAVLHQIPKHLLQPGRIALDVIVLGTEPELGVEILGYDLVPADLVGAAQNLVDAYLLQRELQFAAGDARHVKQVVD